MSAEDKMNEVLAILAEAGLPVFDPTDPFLSDEDIEYECFSPDEDEDGLCDSVIVYTEREAIEYEKKGWTAFPFPRQKT